MYRFALLAVLVPFIAFAAGKTGKPVTLELTLVDDLGLPIGGTWRPTGSPHTTKWFARVPPSWFDAKSGRLTKQGEKHFYANLYGPTWEQGNDDGSKYIPIDLKARALSDKEVAARPWVAANRNLAVFAEDGSVTKVDQPEIKTRHLNE